MNFLKVNSFKKIQGGKDNEVAEFGDLTSEEKEIYLRLKGKSPRWKQLKYYFYLCKKLGIPYETANYYVKVKYKNAGLLFLRIKKLKQMVTLNELFHQKVPGIDKNVGSINIMALNASIIELRKKLEQKFVPLIQEDETEKQ